MIINQAAVYFVVMGNLAFSTVKNPYFHKFVETLRFDYEIPGRYLFMTYLRRELEKLREPDQWEVLFMSVREVVDEGVL